MGPSPRLHDQVLAIPPQDGLGEAQLQGADLTASSIDHADLAAVYVWRAKNVTCKDSRVRWIESDRIIEKFDAVPAMPDEIEKFIERSTASIPTGSRDDAADRMRGGLVINSINDDTAAIAISSATRRTTAGPLLAAFLAP